MPNYNTSPFRAAVQLLYAGIAAYLRGSWPQDKSPTQLYVTSVAIASDVATLGVTVFGGDAPAVGSLISVQGTQTSSGEFNVTNVALTGVDLNSAGVGTLTFALSAANVATTADAGIALAPQPEVAETVADGASVPVAAPNNSFGGDLTKTITAVANFPTLPTDATVSLQGAMFDQDAQYVTVGTIATVSASELTANGLTVTANFLFYRALTSGVSGAGTYTVKIEA